MPDERVGGRQIGLFAALRREALERVGDSLQNVVLPPGSQLQGGTVNTNLNIQGPIDRLVTSGPIDIANAKLAGFNLKSKAAGIGALAGIPSGSDMLIQALNSKLRVAPEGIRADALQLIVPGVGTITGGGRN